MPTQDQILITGGAGFIGSHLARTLLNTGHQVTVIDDLSTGLFSNVAPLEQNPNFRFYVDTIRNERLMERLMDSCHIVYHLASTVGVKLIMDEPVQTIDNIYQGTEVVLRLARRYRNRVLLTSTSEVYGKSEDVPYREDGDRLEGATSKHRWAYASAKALDEFLALAHWKESRVPIIVTRLFNTVGPRQQGQYGMVLPRFVEAALANKPLTVYGDGTQSRCFCHVQDIVTGLTDLMNCATAPGEVFNLGSNEEVSILGLAERVIEIVGSSSTIEFESYEAIYGPGFEDMRRRVPCTNKAREAIGWRATYSLDETIQSVADHIGQGQSLSHELVTADA